MEEGKGKNQGVVNTRDMSALSTTEISETCVPGCLIPETH